MNIGGWDVIYGCSAAVLNRRLREFGDRFLLDVNETISGIGVQAQLTNWEIVNGGASSYIVVEIASSGEIGDFFSYNGLKSKVRVALSYIEDTNASGKIVLNCGEGNVQIVDIDVEGRFRDRPDMQLTLDIIGDAYTRTIARNKDTLAVIFAEITNEGISGIPIKKFKYTWYEPVRETRLMGFLLICGVVQDRDISQLPLIADHNLLYSLDNQAYSIVFMLSAEQFYSLFVRLLPALFRGSKPENYRISNGRIENNGNVSLASVRAGAIDYEPYISSFDFHIDDNSVVTILSGRCPIVGLTDAYIDFALTSRNRAVYRQQENRIVFQKDPNRNISANRDIPSWEEWIGILSLGILNLVIDCISSNLEDTISGRFVECGVDIVQMGFGGVNWGEVPGVGDGGISDNIYVRYRD